MMVAPGGAGTKNLQSLEVAGQSVQLWLVLPGRRQSKRRPVFPFQTRASFRCWRRQSPARTRQAFLLALSTDASGAGALEPLQSFMTNPAGAAVVNVIGPIHQVVRGEDKLRAVTR